MKRILVPMLLAGLLQGTLPAATAAKKTVPTAGPQKAAAAPAAKKPVAASSAARRRVARKRPPFDPTVGDNVDGDDLTVRRAAVSALGNINGSVVVVEPSTGRVLTIVNQKLALKSGFTPCSTIKLVTALAALTEHVIERDTTVKLDRYTRFNLTSAIAKSNNPYFSILGTRLGFERVRRYAQMLGLGEKAGLDIAGEQSGSFPEEPPKFGGVGLLTSFGEGISVTPLQLAALVSAIANGGTLYYLQQPRTQAEIDQFTPHEKRLLDISPSGIADLKVGMRAAVDFGTARRAGYDPTEPILGKTGTCTDFRAPSHMGWFGSFNDVDRHQLAVVVMLTGGKDVSGPVAAGVAGAVYRQLSDQFYFARDTAPKPETPEIISTAPRGGDR